MHSPHIVHNVSRIIFCNRNSDLVIFPVKVLEIRRSVIPTVFRKIRMIIAFVGCLSFAFLRNLRNFINMCFSVQLCQIFFVCQASSGSVSLCHIVSETGFSRRVFGQQHNVSAVCCQNNVFSVSDLSVDVGFNLLSPTVRIISENNLPICFNVFLSVRQRDDFSGVFNTFRKHGVCVTQRRHFQHSLLRSHFPSVCNVPCFNFARRVSIKLSRHHVVGPASLGFHIPLQLFILRHFFIAAVLFRRLNDCLVIFVRFRIVQHPLQLHCFCIFRISDKLHQFPFRLLQSCCLHRLVVSQNIFPVFRSGSAGKSFRLLNCMLHLMNNRVLGCIFNAFIQRDGVGSSVVLASVRSQRRKPHIHVSQFRICFKQRVMLNDVLQSCRASAESVRQSGFFSAPRFVQLPHARFLLRRHFAQQHLVDQTLILCVFRMVLCECSVSAPEILHAGIVDLKSPFPIHAPEPLCLLPDRVCVHALCFHLLRRRQCAQIRRPCVHAAECVLCVRASFHGSRLLQRSFIQAFRLHQKPLFTRSLHPHLCRADPVQNSLEQVPVLFQQSPNGLFIPEQHVFRKLCHQLPVCAFTVQRRSSGCVVFHHGQPHFVQVNAHVPLHIVHDFSGEILIQSGSFHVVGQFMHQNLPHRILRVCINGDLPV